VTKAKAKAGLGLGIAVIALVGLVFSCKTREQILKDKLEGVWIWGKDIYDVNNNKKIDANDSGDFDMPCVYLMIIKSGGELSMFYWGINHQMKWTITDSNRLNYFLPDNSPHDFRFIQSVTEDTLYLMDTVNHGMYNWEVFYRH
jgi:hypothetical protein